jgi:hypothetical protein
MEAETGRVGSRGGCGVDGLSRVQIVAATFARSVVACGEIPSEIVESGRVKHWRDRGAKRRLAPQASMVFWHCMHLASITERILLELVHLKASSKMSNCISKLRKCHAKLIPAPTLKRK